MVKEKIRYDVLNSTYKALVDLVGEDNMLKIYNEFRGSQLQLPMKLYDRQELEKHLKKNTRKNIDVKKLSHTYGFSQRWIKNAISKGDK